MCEIHRMRAQRAEIHDAVNRQLAQLVGQPAAFERLQQTTDHRRLAHPAAPHHRQHPQPVLAQKVPDQPGFDVAVLEIGRGRHRWWIHELRPRRYRLRALRLALALQPRPDTRFGLLGRRHGIRHQPALRLDALAQLKDRALDARLLTRIDAGQFSLGFRQTNFEFPQLPLRRAQPLEVAPQLLEPIRKRPRKIDKLARAKPKR